MGRRARVRAAIAAIVADADAAFDPDELWPANEWDAWSSTPPLKDLYCGAGGVVWRSTCCAGAGYAETGVDLAAAVERTLELLAGGAGPLGAEIELPQPRAVVAPRRRGGAAARRVPASRPAGELADGSSQRVRENVRQRGEELMWGSPGHDARRARDARLDRRASAGSRPGSESAEALEGRRDADGPLDAAALRQGTPLPRPGARPASAIVHALLQAERRRRAPLARETAAILAREAIVEDGLANVAGARGRRRSSPATARSGCSGATARPGWSRPRRRTSTRSSCSPARS